MTRLRFTLVILPALVVLVAGTLPSAIRSADRLWKPAPPAVDSLRRAVAFDEARLAGSRIPRMALDVDPATGIVELRYGATVLRRVRAERIAVSAGIRFAHPDSAVVATVTDRRGLMPPEPVRHVAAPADTAEANDMPTDIPEETAAAFVTVLCGPDLVLHFDPADAATGQRIAGYLYRISERFAANLGSFGSADHPEELTLRLPHADALAFYRALSAGDVVTVRSGPSGASTSR